MTLLESRYPIMRRNASDPISSYPNSWGFYLHSAPKKTNGDTMNRQDILSGMKSIPYKPTQWT